MAEPVTDPISVDPEERFEAFVEYMQSVIPGWEPADGSPDVWMGEGFAQIAAQLGETASDVKTDIFLWYGKNITGLPPIEAVAATATVTLVASAAQGGTVPAGTTFGLRAADGTLIGFATTSTVTVAAGATLAGVAVTATSAGAVGNDLIGPVERVDSIAFLDTVTLDAPTGGGSDAETVDAYLPRLIEEEQLRTVSPILPRDFAKLAKRVLEVDRAAYLDGYNPTDGTDNNPLELTLVPVQADGSDVSPAAKGAIVTQFSEDGATPAIVNFVVHVADPHRTAVDVVWAGVARDGWDPADVEDAGNQAIADFLNAASWGLPDSGEQRAFEVQDKVRLGALYRVLYDVEGLNYVTSLTVGPQGGPLVADDYTLPVTTGEPVPMPLPGTGISGTVT